MPVRMRGMWGSLGAPRRPHRRRLMTAGMGAKAAAEREALRQARQESEQSLAGMRRRFMEAATADRSGGARTTGVRWWLKYCVYGRSRSPFTRLGPNASLEAQVEAEQLLMDFALWLAVCQPSGRPISARSIAKYVSQIRAWHLREFRTPICGDLDYKQMKDLLRGVCRLVAQPERRRRWGVRTQDLSKAVRRFLSTDNPEDAMWAAALQTAFCGLMRGAEFSLQDGEEFNPEIHLTRADLSFRMGSDGLVYVVIMMRPAKGKPGARETVPLILGGGGSLVDAVAALQRMVELDPVAEEEKAVTPLFRRASGAAIRVPEVRAMVKVLMANIGLEPARFGAHSLRIGGATAALAAGVPASAIRVAGRWASDIYEIYTRCSREAAARLAMVIGSTRFEDLERGEQFIDEELMLTTAELPEGPVSDYVEQQLIEDALR